MARRYGFDQELAGRWAECDGGAPTEGGPAGLLGARDFFRGRLTGLYYQEGDPSWCWYELAGLVEKPEDYQQDAVWCEEGFIFLVVDGEGTPLRLAGRSGREPPPQGSRP